MPATYSQMDQGKNRVCVCLREKEREKNKTDVSELTFGESG